MYVCVCLGVIVCVWGHVAECWSLSIKGAYCNFSLWGFYDTVWRCFLAKLVAARHVLYYPSDLCAHSWFSCVTRISFEDDAFYWTCFFVFFFNWLHSNPEWAKSLCFWIVLHYVWVFSFSWQLRDEPYAGILLRLLTNIALRLCSSKVHILPGPRCSTTVFDPSRVIFGTWRLQNPPKSNHWWYECM